MGRPVDMVIEFTGYQRPRRLVETVHMASMELHGGLTFDPIPDSTRMRWSWKLQPRGFKLMYPVVARMGRSQERRVWTGRKRLLEEQKTCAPSSYLGP
jgi:hypothetical protein